MEAYRKFLLRNSRIICALKIILEKFEKPNIKSARCHNRSGTRALFMGGC